MPEGGKSGICSFVCVNHKEILYNIDSTEMEAVNRVVVQEGLPSLADSAHSAVHKESISGTLLLAGLGHKYYVLPAIHLKKTSARTVNCRSRGDSGYFGDFVASP